MVKNAIKTNVIQKAITQVKNGINYMKNKTYKVNGLDSFTPTFNQIIEIANCFELDDYGFSIDDWLGQEFEDCEETKQDYADCYENPNVLSFKPTNIDIKNAKKMVNYLNYNYSDTEILDTYNFVVPRPLTYNDISMVFKSFKKAMLKVQPNSNMINRYNHEIRGMSVINWAD